MEWLGIAMAAALLLGLAAAGVLVMKKMQDRGERGMGDGGPDATGAASSGVP